MANENSLLHQAKRNKKDEFYTQIEDVERELRHYKAQFEGKVIYCNCDDPFISAFAEYFLKNFSHLGLKKLITTCYNNSRPDLFSDNSENSSYMLSYEGGAEMDLPNLSDIHIRKLKGNGDFRSEECINILKDADVVVTNPPFSLFGEYVNQLAAYQKKFIIIGHQNAITYKSIFPLIKENRLWLGYGFKRNMAHFIAPHYEDTASDQDHKEGMIRVSGVVWYTNIDHNKRHELMILTDRYKGSELNYPKYDNYNAIEVSKTASIPSDYSGAMGVPITFLTKYNPEQFEIIGCSYSYGVPHGFHNTGMPYDVSIKGKPVYKRLFIKHKRAF
jgi:hypothetical protein